MLTDSDTGPLLSGNGIKVLVMGKVTVAGAVGFRGKEMGSGRKPPWSTAGQPGPSRGTVTVPGTNSQPPVGTTDIFLI